MDGTFLTFSSDDTLDRACASMRTGAAFDREDRQDCR